MLEWQQPDAIIENVLIYHITYAAQNGSNNNPQVDTSDTTMKTITPLSPNTKYNFSVQAENNVGPSDPSEMITVTTPPQSGELVSMCVEFITKSLHCCIYLSIPMTILS